MEDKLQMLEECREIINTIRFEYIRGEITNTERLELLKKVDIMIDDIMNK